MNTYGSLTGKNGEIDTIKIFQLFVADLFFFNPDTDIKWNGASYDIKGIQINAETMHNYPHITNNAQVFATAIIKLLTALENNSKLKVPKENINKSLYQAILGNDLTAVSLFHLASLHCIPIIETSPNNYAIPLDIDIKKGVPNAHDLVTELVKALREYNGVTDEFNIGQHLSSGKLRNHNKNRQCL